MRFWLCGSGEAKFEIEPKVWEGVCRYILSTQDKEGPVVKPQITLAPRVSEPLNEEEGRGRRRRGTGVKKKPKIIPPLTGEEMVEAQERAFRYETTKESGNWNMTCAGVSTVAYDFGGEGSPQIFEKQCVIRSAMASHGWRKHGPTDNCYGMYSLEKVDLGGIKKIGDHDWYQVISEHLLSNQNSEGSWINMGWYAGNATRVDTAFALLILKRASAMLTRSATTFVIFSGGGSSSEKEQSDEWALLADSGRSCPFADFGSATPIATEGQAAEDFLKKSSRRCRTTSDQRCFGIWP